MDQLNQILERVLTLNVNAGINTNIDIQGIIEKWIMYTTLGKVLIGLLGALTILITVFLVTRLVTKQIQASYLLKAGDEIEKRIKELGNWDTLRDFDTNIKEILSFMPRNKKPRKTD